MSKRSVLPLGKWTVSVDVEATRAIYANEKAGADVCVCGMCKSYGSVRAVAIPARGRAMLEVLGIDPSKEEEIVWGYPAEDGYRFFEGWFHFVGEVVSGGPAFNEKAEPQHWWDQITGRFGIGVSAGRGLPCFEAFRKGHSEAVEFRVEVAEATPGFRKLRAPEFEELEPPAP